MSPPSLEFSRPQAVGHVPAKGLDLTLEASEAECAQIARRLGIPAIEYLRAEIALKPLSRTGSMAVNGRLTARVIQTCGVTLQPVSARLDESFQLTFAPEETILDQEGEIELALDDEDPPDPIIDGTIDLGEVVVEHLALALDPFPRAEGAAFHPPVEDVAPEDTERANPFAVLASWKPRKR